MNDNRIYSNIGIAFAIAADALQNGGNVFKLVEQAVAQSESVHGPMSPDEKNYLLLLAGSAHSLASAAVQAAKKSP